MRYGMEQMGAAGAAEPWRGGEAHHDLPIESPEVQAALMLAAFASVHHQSNVDAAHWEHNDTAVQNAAMSEWVGDLDDKSSRAALYRAYVDEHPHMSIDIDDEVSLQKVLAELVNKKMH